MDNLVIGNKYNKSEIMREAWNMMRHGSKDFGECMGVCKANDGKNHCRCKEECRSTYALRRVQEQL